MSTFEKVYFLCTEEQFKRYIPSEYCNWILKHFQSSIIKKGKEIDNSVLIVKEGKVYLNPVELIQSLLDIKKKIENDPNNMIYNQIPVINIDTFFGDEKKLKAKKILKTVLRQVCDFILFKGMDIYMRIEDAFRLYEGYKMNINPDLEDISIIINQIFSNKEKRKLYHDLNRQKED